MLFESFEICKIKMTDDKLRVTSESDSYYGN